MHQVSVKNVKEDLHLKLLQWGRENEFNIAEIKCEKIFKEWIVLMEKYWMIVGRMEWSK